MSLSMFLVLDYAKYALGFPQFHLLASNRTFSQLACIMWEASVTEIKMN